MNEDITLASKAEHTDPFLGSVYRVKTMLPEPTSMRIMRVLMHQVTGHRYGVLCSCREGEDTAQRVFINEKITCGEGQAVSGYSAGIFKASFRVQMADNGAAVTFEVFGSDQYRPVNLEANGEVCGILKLVAHVATEIGHVPAHTQGGQGTQDAAGVEFPGVIRVVEITVGSEVVVRDHGICLHPTCCWIGRRYRFGHSMLR